MKRESQRIERNRQTVKELTDQELRHVLGGQNIPSIPVNPPNDRGGSGGGDVTADPLHLKR